VAGRGLRRFTNECSFALSQAKEKATRGSLFCLTRRAKDNLSQ
jgi:hypothetical protein